MKIFICFLRNLLLAFGINAIVVGRYEIAFVLLAVEAFLQVRANAT